MTRFELLLRVDVPTPYIVVAMPEGHAWTDRERSAPYWRIVRVPLLPIEIDALTDPTPRKTAQDSARLKTLHAIGLPAMARDGITDVSRARFLAAVR